VCNRTVNAASFLKFAGSLTFPVTNRDVVKREGSYISLFIQSS